MRMSFVCASLACLMALSPAPAAADGEGRKVEITGKLRTGVAAVGGETTGVVLRTERGTFELDLGQSGELRGKAAGLDGKRVTVTGRLRIRPGVEVRERRVVAVETLEPEK
jgi:hypothetical protein